MKRMRIIDGKPTKRFERAWGIKAIMYEREIEPEKWLLLGIGERDYYAALRCFARDDSRAGVKALGPLAAIMTERGNKKLEMPSDRALENWAFAIYPPLRERDSEPELQPTPPELMTV